MPRFAANLSMMYTEHAFLERFAAAAYDGFKAVEYLFPYDFAAEDIRARLDAHHLEQALFNAPPGDWAAGERGTASLAGREDEFRRGIDQAARLCARARQQEAARDGRHGAAGRRPCAPSRHLPANLRHATQAAFAHGITILIEPINPRDMPGYFLSRQGRCARDLRGSRRAEPEGAVRLLPLPDRRRRSRDEAQARFRGHRPYPDRGRARAPRAGYRRTQLPVSVRADRRARLRRLDRLRVPPEGRHVRSVPAGSPYL